MLSHSSPPKPPQMSPPFIRENEMLVTWDLSLAPLSVLPSSGHHQFPRFCFQSLGPLVSEGRSYVSALNLCSW